jgi:AmmeMemoRadiSam system protein B
VILRLADAGLFHRIDTGGRGACVQSVPLPFSGADDYAKMPIMGVGLRPSPIAGLWYEGDRKALAREVDAYLDGAQLPPLEGQVVAVVAPHAGHRYSGPVAGYAFAAVRGSSPDLVAILSPFHNYHQAPLLMTSCAAYETPLGSIAIDGAAVGNLEELLAAEQGLPITRIDNDPEHSLEIELPFLQRALASRWQLLPLMVRVQDAKSCRGIGEALAQVLQERDALLVASTDLSHYHEQQTALALDRTLLSQLEAFEPEPLFDLERSGRASACGLGALAAVMWAARGLGADKVEILRHATSGDTTGDYSAVVGYGAAAMLKTK